MDAWGTQFSIFDHGLKDEFILILCSVPKSVTESTDEMIIELFKFKTYLFSLFITAHNHCLGLISI